MGWTGENSSVAEEQPPEQAQTARAGAGRSTSLTRRRFLAAAGGGVTAAAALYAGLALIERPARRVVGPPPGGYPEGQYQIVDYGARAQADPETAVDVIIPPVWNLVITAQLTRPPGRHEQQRLEAALRAVESAYPYSPAGVFALVAYGLPYFRSYVQPEVFAAHLPRMVDSGAPAVLDAIRFAGDHPSTRLEANDVIFHLRSDTLDNLRDVQHALFARSGTLAGRPASRHIRAHRLHWAWPAAAVSRAGAARRRSGDSSGRPALYGLHVDPAAGPGP
jgi:hypothetical protein